MHVLWAGSVLVNIAKREFDLFLEIHGSYFTEDL